jgi:hypothetical protein
VPEDMDEPINIDGDFEEVLTTLLDADDDEDADGEPDESK